MNGQKTTAGEINSSPIPRQFQSEVAKTGLLISLYYENITTEGLPVDYPDRAFGYYCIAHLLHGHGFFRDAATPHIQTFAPGFGVLVSPHFVHRYGGFKGPFTEDAICFTGATADALHRAGIIRNGLIYLGAERPLLPIIQRLKQPTLAAQFEAHAMLLNLLLEVRPAQPRSDEGKLERLIKELQKQGVHWWSVGEMAEFCNVSENHFRKIFRRHTGMAPAEYNNCLRLNRAVELLCVKRLPIREIAAELGFADTFYFFRLFKAHTGQTPAAYRAGYDRERSL